MEKRLVICVIVWSFIQSLSCAAQSISSDTASLTKLNRAAKDLIRSDPDSALKTSLNALDLSKQLLLNEGSNQELMKFVVGSIAGSYNVIGTVNYIKDNYSRALLFYDKSLKTRKHLKDSSGVSASMGNIGAVYMKMGNYDEALVILNEAYEQDKLIGNKKGMVYHLSNIGNIYNVKSNYPLALEYYFKSLKILEELDNKSEIARLLMGIAVVYDQQGDIDKALDNYNKALQINLEMNNKVLAGNNYGAIGIIHFQKKNFKEALEHFNQALKSSEEIESMEDVAIWLGNISLVYDEQGDLSTHQDEKTILYNKALEFSNKALAIDEEIGNQNEIAQDLCTIGMILRKIGKSNEAEAVLKKALALSSQLESLESVKNASENLYLLYSEKEMHKAAFEFYKRFVEARDNIFNEENTRKSVQAQMQYQFDKKEAAIKAEQDKKNALAKEENKKQSIIRNSFISGFILVLLLAILIYRGYRNKKKANVVITMQKEEVEKAKTIIEKQKHLVEEKQKEILDSIHYARRIQRSLLTQDKYLEKNLQRLSKKSA